LVKVQWVDFVQMSAELMNRFARKDIHNENHSVLKAATRGE
jgi:hypothetical protein